MPAGISHDLLSSSPPPPEGRSSGIFSARFPVGLCALQIVLTCAGLAAAALGVRWGASPPHGGEALDAAWLYVNILLVTGWMVGWPAVAYARFRAIDREEPSPPYARQLLWDLPALILGAGPALAVAAFITPANTRQLAVTLAAQGALMIFALGILMCGFWTKPGPHRTSPGRFEGIAAGILSALALAGPVAVYFWAEFFPQNPAQWFIAVPMMAVHQAAVLGGVDGGAAGIPPVLWVAAGYAAVGLILFMIGVKE